MTDSEALVRLQELDLELIRQKRLLENLPQRASLEKIRAALKKVAADHTKIVGVRKDLEMDIADHDEDHKRVEALVSEAQDRAKGNEGGYHAIKDLEGELSGYAKRLERIEFESNGLMSEYEKTERAERNASALLEKLTKQQELETASYKKEIASIKHDVDVAQGERDELVKGMDPDLFKRYLAACRRFSGIAVETLNGNKPSVCRVALQPSQYADLKHAGSIAECPYCHRILVRDVSAES